MRPDRTSVRMLCLTCEGGSQIATARTALWASPRITWTSQPDRIEARMIAPQYQVSFACRRASPGSRYSKRGASANASAKTLAAEGTWSARMRDIRGSVMKHAGPNGQITDRGLRGPRCATGSPTSDAHRLRYHRRLPSLRERRSRTGAAFCRSLAAPPPCPTLATTPILPHPPSTSRASSSAPT